MELLEENFFKNLISKIKTTFSSKKNDEYYVSPEQEMLEEIVGYLQLEIYELRTYLQSEYSNLKDNQQESQTTYNKMDNVGRLIREILNSVKEYKLKTNSDFSEDVYSITAEQLHTITSETSLIDYEKVLIKILKDILKLTNDSSHKIEGNDEEDSAYEHYLRLFKYFPTKDFNLLLDIESGIENPKEHSFIKIQYENATRKIFDKRKTHSTDVNITKNNEYENEWKSDSIDDEFKKFLDKRLITDYNTLWDEKFKFIWREIHAKEVEKHRQKVAHLKEAILKEFTRE